MAVEFKRYTNIIGRMKELAVVYLPGPYVMVRTWKNRFQQVWEDARRFPYISKKEIDGISFFMQVANRREQWIVDGPCFEEELLAAMIECIRPADTIFDVGAATGTHTIPCAKKTGQDGTVYSFEPDSQCAGGLRDNLALNGIGNVVVLETALWNKDTSVVLHTGGRSGVPSRVNQNGSVPGGFNRQQPIHSRSIESLVRSGQVKPPDILKIDVEGSGGYVLEGLGGLRPRDIFMEVHPLLGENRDAIVELLSCRGYQVVWERPRGGELHIHFAI